jgi:hypothetical protein
MSLLRRFDVEFLNTLVRVIALRNSPEIVLVGLIVGPFREGEIYNLYYWIAENLEKEGILKIGEEKVLTLEQLEKLRFLQSTQKGGALLPLPSMFYPMAKRLVIRLSESTEPTNIRKGERAAKSIQDLVNLRLAIIVRGALSGLAKPAANQTPEEESLYWELHRSIGEHKKAFMGKS